MLHYLGANLLKVIINFKLFNPALLVFPVFSTTLDRTELNAYGYVSVIVLLSAVSHYPNSHKRAPPSTGFSGKWSPRAICTLRRLGETVSVCVCLCVYVIQSDKETERERKRE